jgi:hypothetical protein
MRLRSLLRGRVRLLSQISGGNRVDVPKIPLLLFLGAVCHARGGHRINVARRLLSSPSHDITPAVAEDCEFRCLTDYGKNYAHLSALLGCDGKIPPAGEIEFLHSMLHRPVQHLGAIGWPDCCFLTALISVLAPPRVIEIGTLTGFSAAVIAAALSRRHGNNSGAWVDTIDVRLRCLIDETRPTGFEIPELIPDLTTIVRLHIPHDATFVRELAKRDELEIVFIDANHCHPQPLLDLLRVAPYVRSGGWIVLHDIQLGTLGRKAIEAGQGSTNQVFFNAVLERGAPYGPEWLFDSWPFRKVSGGNIGAVQLPNDKSALIPFALRLMSLPFEITGKAATRARRALYHSFGALT